MSLFLCLQLRSGSTVSQVEDDEEEDDDEDGEVEAGAGTAWPN